MVFDLDPGEGMGLAECAEVARLVRDLVSGMGLEAMPVTSGSKGIHLYTALDGRRPPTRYRRSRTSSPERSRPTIPSSSCRACARPCATGRVLIDWSQNNGKKTTIAPYSLRGRFRPTVAAPRTWEELDDPDLRHLEAHEVLERVASGDDPLAVITAASHDGPLAEYLSMRTTGDTPEPMPVVELGRADRAATRRFVIQEHHARRLHFDLRLERDGVLKSWAVPKGVPETAGVNHLAVQTEDHPMEYATFEGTIPAGEYGAGSMTIWDSGTYETEKWRDDEVIIDLDGQPGGPLGGARAPRPHPHRRLGREEQLAAAPHEGPAAGSLGPTSKARTRRRRLRMPRRRMPRRRMPRQTRRLPTAARARRRTTTGTADAIGPAAPRPRPREGGRGDREDGPHEVGPILVRPMLATAGTVGMVARGDWALEWKWDGIRVLARVEGGGVRLMSRNGNDMTASGIQSSRDCPRSSAATRSSTERSSRSTTEGRPSFERMQQRMGPDQAPRDRAARRHPCRFGCCCSTCSRSTAPR